MAVQPAVHQPVPFAGRPAASARRPRNVGAALTAVFLVVSIVLVLFPFVFALSTSTKSYDEFLHQLWLPRFPPELDNYAIAWQLVRTYLWNTVLVSAVSVVFTLLFSSLTAYVFARQSFPGKDVLFFLILILIMLPGVLTLLPRFMLVQQLGLLNTYWALILPYIAGGQAFAIFVLRIFIASLPEELFEAARMDGASDLQMYYKLAVPLSKAILGTLAILQTRDIWNDLIWPLITLSDPKYRTISVGLAFLNSDQQSQFGAIFAGYFLASIPMIVLFAFTMRQFMAGLTSGALKV